MEDEEFEKVFKKIEDVFHFGVYFDDCKDPDGSYTWDETERKQKLKEILEEIYLGTTLYSKFKVLD